MCLLCVACECVLGHWWRPGPVLALLTYSQCLDGLQRSKEPLADGLQLVVIQREQAEALQVLERVHPQAVDLVGIEEAADRREAADSLIPVRPAEQGRGCRPQSILLTASLPPSPNQRKGTCRPPARDLLPRPGTGSSAPRMLCAHQHLEPSPASTPWRETGNHTLRAPLCTVEGRASGSQKERKKERNLWHNCLEALAD